MRRAIRRPGLLGVLLLLWATSVSGADRINPTRAPETTGWYFPPPGEGLDRQDRHPPRDVGLDPAVLAELRGKATRWAVWRHGYLVHAEGDWNRTQDVASLRKTWHALAVGAAIGQGKIPHVRRKLADQLPDLEGRDAEATWWHVITQSTGFDFPHPDSPDVGDPTPGEVWTYSDKNPVRLCDALARAFGKAGFRDGYDDVLRAAYFDAIGLRGWSTRALDDGIRLVLDLEDMGRLGLLVLARGRWGDRQVIPRDFVEALERKQTYGMRPVYNGPDDGNVGQGWFQAHRDRFPEAPYGYMTWVNTEGDLYPGADRGWAYGAGRGGTRILWNHRYGIVYAGVGVEERPSSRGLAHALEVAVLGPNPLVPGSQGLRPRVERHGRFEAAFLNDRTYRDPYNDVTLAVTWWRPDGTKVQSWGFYDGGQTWRLRVHPDLVGTWHFQGTFSDRPLGLGGQFECVPSDRPGPVGVLQDNPTWFGRGDRPMLLRGLHVGDRFLAANWPDARRAAFLDWAHAQGYNTLSIASCLLNRDDPGRGRGWETPDLWPLDAAEFRRLEGMLDELDRRGFVVYPFAGFFGQRSDYPHDPADQERYIRYALARLGPYGNLLFNVAGPEPNLGKVWMAHEDVERLGCLIGRLDPFGHPLSVHNRTGVDPYRDSDWTTFGTVQGPKTKDRGELSRKLLDWHHPRKPLLAQETLWSGNVNHFKRFEGGRDYSDDDLRKNGWVILMSGANFVFADNAGDSSTGFSGTMDLDDRRQARHDVIRRVWDAFESVPYGRMKPRQDLVDRGYCLAEEGREYLVYLESRATVNVRVEGEPYAVEWIDPGDASDRRRAGITADGRALTPPAEGDDWLLRLTKVSPIR